MPHPLDISFANYASAIYREQARTMARQIDDDILNSLYPLPMPSDHYTISADTAFAEPLPTWNISMRNFIYHDPTLEPVMQAWVPPTPQVNRCGKCGGTGSIRMDKRNDWRSLRGTPEALSPNRRYPCDVCNREEINRTVTNPF